MKFGELRDVEVHFRDDVARVQLRVELADREADVVAVDAVPVALGQRVELLGLLAGAEVGVEDEVRPDDLRVVRADAAVGVQVVGVEEAPLVGPAVISLPRWSEYQSLNVK